MIVPDKLQVPSTLKPALQLMVEAPVTVAEEVIKNKPNVEPVTPDVVFKPAPEKVTLVNEVFVKSIPPIPDVNIEGAFQLSALPKSAFLNQFFNWKKDN